jgi:hypothetical protein
MQLLEDFFCENGKQVILFSYADRDLNSLLMSVQINNDALAKKMQKKELRIINGCDISDNGSIIIMVRTNKATKITTKNISNVTRTLIKIE